jgi:aminopeptidase N
MRMSPSLVFAAPKCEARGFGSRGYDDLGMGRLCLFLAALFGLSFPDGRASSAPTPPGAYNVFAYELDLAIDRDRKILTGRERLRLRSAQDGLAAISFPLNGIAISTVTSATGQPLPYDVADGHLEIRPPTPLARNEELSIALTYEAQSPKGVVFQPDAVYTSFYTCHWMVCRDRPDDKATFSLSVTVPDGLSFVTNGAPVGHRAAAGAPGRQTWKDVVPSSSYLFGFVLGKLSTVTRKHRGVTFEYDFADRDEAWRKRVFADDDRMFDFFVEKAGRPLPRTFYRQVVVEGGAAQEMSSFSVLGRETLDTRLEDPHEDWLVAHELAHQFWGNLVTCADWSHFWLNEGLTVFIVAAYKERRWGRPAYDHELGLSRARHQAAIDAKLDVPLTFDGEYPSLRMKRAIVYNKAALFLDLLRTTMGERPFWTALRTYTRRFAGKSVVSRDFQRVFAAATDRDLSKLFDEWVYGRAPEKS